MEIGIFDFPAPLLSWADRALDPALPDGARLVLWAVLAGATSMGLYWLSSPQGKLNTAKRDATAARRALADYDGDFDGLWPLMGRSLATSFRHLGLALGPALLGSLPVLMLMGWMAGQYGFDLPAAGEPVRIQAEPSDVDLQWTDRASLADTNPWVLIWPEPGEPASLTDVAGRPLLTLPLTHPVPVIHKRAWWNLFFANPLGTLPPDAPVDLIDIGLRPRVFLPFGPSWLRSWEAPFILVVLIASMAVKILFRIR
ncbi:MAG: hypothetical protein JSU82_12605 [Rhodospirillales bacterium]|nr:MAG: hypothetical protein JSU82_12605 [Rhodospirillales bacterium]